MRNTIKDPSISSKLGSVLRARQHKLQALNRLLTVEGFSLFLGGSSYTQVYQSGENRITNN